MPLPTPEFEEGQAWDGTTPRSRPNTDVFKRADGEIGRIHSSEIIALEELLKDVVSTIELLENPGAANSVLGVKNDQSGLEYKTLVEGVGITITHGTGTVTIASGIVSSLAEADSQIKIGNLIYLKSDGHMDLAKADNSSTAQAVGVAIEDANAAEACSYITEGQVERGDWTTIADVVSLTPGVSYFSSAATAGKITATAPTIVGQYVVRVGRAISATKLDIEIESPILL